MGRHDFNALILFVVQIIELRVGRLWWCHPLTFPFTINTVITGKDSKMAL
ncbi:hypothetical protein ARZXY2_4885 (plasmid) [Arthrobacter sp. ZXY-2]|nr:hypothetical protein ARZXY2_4885 [Arthrobacter sp. ZXY-2]